MKRSGFTMIELIFVIVIIGILSAVAIPKFQNLKEHAHVRSVIKVITDSMGSVPPAAVNKLDLDDNTTFELKDIVPITGKGWEYDSTILDGNYAYTDPANDTKVADINLSVSGRELNVSIDCSKFNSSREQAFCREDLNITTSQSFSKVIDF